jgi:hypothetical protein
MTYTVTAKLWNDKRSYDTGLQLEVLGGTGVARVVGHPVEVPDDVYTLEYRDRGGETRMEVEVINQMMLVLVTLSNRPPIRSEVHNISKEQEQERARLAELRLSRDIVRRLTGDSRV